MTKPGYVYILASRRNGTLYVDVTSNLVRRVHQHRDGLTKGFASKYGVHRLVYYEIHDRIDDAIRREKAVENGTGNGSLI